MKSTQSYSPSTSTSEKASYISSQNWITILLCLWFFSSGISGGTGLRSSYAFRYVLCSQILVSLTLEWFFAILYSFLATLRPLVGNTEQGQGRLFSGGTLGAISAPLSEFLAGARGRFPPLSEGTALVTGGFVSVVAKLCRVSPHSYNCLYIQPKARHKGRMFGQGPTKFWESQIALQVLYQDLPISGKIVRSIKLKLILGRKGGRQSRLFPIL